MAAGGRKGRRHHDCKLVSSFIAMRSDKSIESEKARLFCLALRTGLGEGPETRSTRVFIRLSRLRFSKSTNKMKKRTFTRVDVQRRRLDNRNQASRSSGDRYRETSMAYATGNFTEMMHQAADAKLAAKKARRERQRPMTAAEYFAALPAGDPFRDELGD
jgi:hypothetical protein